MGPEGVARIKEGRIQKRREAESNDDVRPPHPVTDETYPVTTLMRHNSRSYRSPEGYNSVALVHSQRCVTITTISFRTFSSPQTLSPLAITPLLVFTSTLGNY